MPASSLRDIWIGVAHDQGIECVDIGVVTSDRIGHLAAASSDKPTPMMIGCGDGPFSHDLMKAASRLLHGVRRVEGDGASAGLICVTGSLHMVSSVLRQLE
jgi:hypothetical protein